MWILREFPYSDLTRGPFLESPEKPFVRLRPAYSVKPVFSYVVKGIKIKITAKFRASRRLSFEDTKRITDVTRNAPEKSQDFRETGPGLQGRSCYMQLFLRILYRASYLCLKVMPSQASRIPVRCEQKWRFPTPLPTLYRKLTFSHLLTFQPITFALFQHWSNQLKMKWMVFRVSHILWVINLSLIHIWRCRRS